MKHEEALKIKKELRFNNNVSNISLYKHSSDNYSIYWIELINKKIKV